MIAIPKEMGQEEQKEEKKKGQTQNKTIRSMERELNMHQRDFKKF